MSLWERDPVTGDLNLIAGGTYFSDNPIGSIIPFGGDIAPKGWFVCDGSAKSRTAYPDLFAAIGTSYGEGDGSTTFNLPDLRGKVLVGLNPSDTSFDTLGKTGGEKTHILIENEMPSHTHTQDAHNHTQNAHNHTTTYNYLGVSSGSANVSYVAGSSYNFPVSNGVANKTATNNAQTATNQNTGGGLAHNNLQPYAVSNYIIKAFSTELPADLDKKVTLTMSHVGMIIQSTTLDTLEKVKNVYGADTDWIQHSGYILRGATSNVTADDNSNSGRGFGGSDTHELTIAEMPSHTHTQNAHSHSVTSSGAHGHTYPYRGQAGDGYVSYKLGSTAEGNSSIPTTGSAHTHTIDNNTATNQNTGGGTANVKGAAHSVIQRYKNIYIWERVS